MTAPRDTRVNRVAIYAASTALIVLVAASLFVAAFASEQSVARLALCEPGDGSWMPPLIYIGSILALAFLYWAATALARGGRAPRALSGVLLGVSVAGILFSGWLALLSVGFWATARNASAADTIATALLFLVAIVAPALASLAAAVMVGTARSHPLPAALPALIVIAVSASSVIVLLVGLATSCL